MSIVDSFNNPEISSAILPASAASIALLVISSVRLPLRWTSCRRGLGHLFSTPTLRPWWLTRGRWRDTWRSGSRRALCSCFRFVTHSSGGRAMFSRAAGRLLIGSFFFGWARVIIVFLQHLLQRFHVSGMKWMHFVVLQGFCLSSENLPIDDRCEYSKKKMQVGLGIIG